MRPVKKVALLHDICGVGKAALTNMMPILGSMGIESCPIPTMLLSTHTGGYQTPAIHKIPGEFIQACADHYKEQGINFEAIFIGYLGNVEVIDAVIYFIQQFPNTKVIFDPIMGDHGKCYQNFDESYGIALRKLLPYADVILPNLTEVCLLTGREYTEINDHRQVLSLCRELEKYGARDMIITSVPKDDCRKGMVLYENHAFLYLGSEDESGEYHGTGDAFDGMFLSRLLQGYTLLESVQASHAFVSACIRESARYDYPEREGLLIEKTLKKLG
jgi:pyridoxine kinase